MTARWMRFVTGPSPGICPFQKFALEPGQDQSLCPRPQGAARDRPCGIDRAARAVHWLGRGRRREGNTHQVDAPDFESRRLLCQILPRNEDLDGFGRAGQDVVMMTKGPVWSVLERERAAVCLLHQRMVQTFFGWISFCRFFPNCSKIVVDDFAPQAPGSVDKNASWQKKTISSSSQPTTRAELLYYAGPGQASRTRPIGTKLEPAASLSSSSWAMGIICGPGLSSMAEKW
jgi:hypothetical protein